MNVRVWRCASIALMACMPAHQHRRGAIHQRRRARAHHLFHRYAGIHQCQRSSVDRYGQCATIG
eukprot:49190-Eustigmatos_ZCMA.PRE.1